MKHLVNQLIFTTLIATACTPSVVAEAQPSQPTQQRSAVKNNEHKRADAPSEKATWRIPSWLQDLEPYELEDIIHVVVVVSVAAVIYAYYKSLSPEDQYAFVERYRFEKYYDVTRREERIRIRLL